MTDSGETALAGGGVGGEGGEGGAEPLIGWAGPEPWSVGRI